MSSCIGKASEIDEASQHAINTSKSTRLVVDTMLKSMEKEPTGRRTASTSTCAKHPWRCWAPTAWRVFAPNEPEPAETEISAAQEPSSTGRSTRCTAPSATWSTHLADLPFDHFEGVVPNDGGRVLEIDGVVIEATYVTGWIKRGPIGLIGTTKSDARRDHHQPAHRSGGHPRPRNR